MNITNFLSALDEQISSQLIEMDFEKFDNFNFVRNKAGHEINVLLALMQKIQYQLEDLGETSIKQNEIK